jgi:hypothetical protein
VKILSFCTLCLIVCLNANIGQADIAYSEASDGDLAGPATPTPLGTIDLGLNTITGQLSNSAGFDPDAFSFVVAGGQQLDSVSFTTVNGSGHFFAFNDGPLSQFNGSGNLISTLLGNGDIGTNILDGSLNSFGGSGLSGGPLAAGTYNVWFQETGGATVDYSLAISTSAVPEPSSAAMIFAAAAVLASRRRRRTQ